MKTGFIIFLASLLSTSLSLDAKENDTNSLHFNSQRGFQPFKYATSENINLNNNSDTLARDYIKIDAPTHDLIINFRAINEHSNPLKRYPYYNREGTKNMVKSPHWGFFVTSECDTLVVLVKTIEKESLPEPIPAVEIGIYNTNPASPLTKTFFEGINPYDKANIWKLEINEKKARLQAGDRGLIDVGELEFAGDSLHIFGFLSGWGANLKVSEVHISTNKNRLKTENSFDLEEVSKQIEASDDPLEGYYTIYDRDLEESLLKLGGLYTLACLKQDDDYYFLYLDGASINKDNWEKGDVKIVMRPTPFSGLYDVEWIDSMGETLNHEIKAQRGEGDTLTIQFPYQASKIRLRRIP